MKGVAAAQRVLRSGFLVRDNEVLPLHSRARAPIASNPFSKIERRQMPILDRPPEDQAAADIEPENSCAPHRPAMHNRVQILMIHTSRYAFQGQARLAADVHVSRSTISRMLRGKTRPSYHLAQAVAAALAKHLKRPLDPRDLFSPDGFYPERSGCALAGCSGCLPDEAYDSHGRRKPEWRNARPGDWSRSPESP